MKKFKRTFTFLMALSMLCAAALPASAVDHQTAADMQRSEFAGGTKHCTIVEASFDGAPNIVHEVDVSIPSDATVADENALVAMAVQETTGVPATSSDIAPMSSEQAGRISYTELSHDGPFNLASVPITMYVGGGTLQANYSRLYVTFNNMTPGANANTFHVEAANNKHPGEAPYKTAPIVIHSFGTVIVMAKGANSGGTLYLNQGDTISIWAALEQGSIFVRDVTVEVN